MSTDIYQNLCKKCFIKLCKPSKKEIKRIIMTEYQDKCEHCGKFTEIVEEIAEWD